MSPIFNNEDYGKDEDTSKGMLRRTQALTIELQGRATKVLSCHSAYILSLILYSFRILGLIEMVTFSFILKTGKGETPCYV